MQDRIDSEDFKTKSKAVAVPVEPTVERKGLYRSYLASLQALQDIVGKVLFEPDMKALAIHNVQHEIIGKGNRKAIKFEWSKQVEMLGTTMNALEEGATH